MTPPEPTVIALRRARPADFEAFKPLYEAVAAEGRWIGGELPVDWERRRSLWARIDADPRLRVYFAEVDGRIVGWLSAEQDAAGVVSVGMAVLREWRGRGVGSALMGTAVEWARRVGSHKMTLFVWPHNPAARALYEKFGFRVEGRRRRQWRRRNGELWDDLVMGLVLDEDAPGSPYDEDAPGSPCDDAAGA